MVIWVKMRRLARGVRVMVTMVRGTTMSHRVTRLMSLPPVTRPILTMLALMMATCRMNPRVRRLNMTSNILNIMHPKRRIKNTPKIKIKMETMIS